MLGKQSSGETKATDAAFNHVLEAEAEAREQVEACRREAASMVAAAEEQARALVRRTESRILLAHRLADASVERALTSLHDAQLSARDEGPDELALSRLNAAIEGLADEMVGTAPAALHPSDSETVS